MVMTINVKIGVSLIGLMAAVSLSLPAQAKFQTGQTLPDMQVVDSNGVTHSLSDFTGQNIVLEWTNHDCPYVKKHYNPEYKNMQGLQKQAASDDVVWLSIVSSGPGQQGYVSGAEANGLTLSREAAPAAVILDPAGAAGLAFSAKTTPHMFVINKDRELIYQGAIDSDNRSRVSTIPGAVNYVAAALDALKTGAPLAETDTTPYGCSVKYAKPSY
jgi:peroxiredoxin